MSDPAGRLQAMNGNVKGEVPMQYTRSQPYVRQPRAHTTRLSVAEAAIVLAMVTALAIAALSSGSAVIDADSVSTSIVRVEPRDTLWSIAARFPVDGRPTVETVTFIRALNGLQTSTLQPGQALIVPSSDGSLLTASN
jgi:LysM repeat protein